MKLKNDYVQLNLFNKEITENHTAFVRKYIPRSSLNYIGSKHTLLSFISESIFEIVGDVSALTLADLFAGTGAVVKYFKDKVKHTIVNDLETYSFVLNRNYIGNNYPFPYEKLMAQLNDLPGVEGLIYNHYCLGSGSGRQYFSDDNGQKIDAIRQQIERWNRDGVLNKDQYYFLLATLIESADRVANVASVYGAFLKHLKKTAQKRLWLEPALFYPSEGTSDVYQMDANQLIRQIEGDILYLDPPYNHRQYGANYHLLNTIALYDTFEPQGKTGLRNYDRSDYCRRDKVALAFEDLVAKARFKYIFLSYNNEGLMPVDQVQEIMSNYGAYLLKTKTYQRFKADKDSNRNHKASRTEEYLHILIK